jgi:hypothetical protein
MNDVKNMRTAIAGLEKHISLNQIAKRSGINYVTLMNIKKEKSKRVTDSVKARFDAFVASFNPAPAAAAAPAVSPVERKKPGPKKGAKAAKKLTLQKAAPKKRGPKKGAKKLVSNAPVNAPSKLDFASPVLGQALDREIEIAEARLEYLQSLREIEDEFLKAVGRK